MDQSHTEERRARDDLTTPGNIYQIGVEPIRIDILTTVDGVDFGPAWQNRISFDEQGMTVPCLNKADLLRSKRAAGRPGDLRDIEELERLP